MPLFFYSARNERNTLVHGTIDAFSAQAARDSLQQMNMVAEELHEATLKERKQASDKDEDITPAKKFITPNEVYIDKTPSIDHSFNESATTKRRTRKSYYPFFETLRLYTGWLLAWYILVYAFGSYQHVKDISFRIPYVEALLPPFSPIVLRFAFTCFVFLAFSNIYTFFGSKSLHKKILTALGIGIFALYLLNV
ncbi:MAG: hypothetical protein O2904_00755 [bacterium]|nr:hypothetical protein [bacterium]